MVFPYNKNNIILLPKTIMTEWSLFENSELENTNQMENPVLSSGENSVKLVENPEYAKWKSGANVYVPTQNIYWAVVSSRSFEFQSGKKTITYEISTKNDEISEILESDLLDGWDRNLEVGSLVSFGKDGKAGVIDSYIKDTNAGLRAIISSGVDKFNIPANTIGEVNENSVSEIRNEIFSSIEKDLEWQFEWRLTNAVWPFKTGTRLEKIVEIIGEGKLSNPSDDAKSAIKNLFKWAIESMISEMDDGMLYNIRTEWVKGDTAQKFDEMIFSMVKYCQDSRMVSDFLSVVKESIEEGFDVNNVNVWPQVWECANRSYNAYNTWMERN